MALTDQAAEPAVVLVHHRSAGRNARSTPSGIDGTNIEPLSPLQDVVPRSHDVPIDDSILSAFIYRCETGDLAEAKNIARVYDIDPEDVRMRDNAALYGACYNNHLDVAQWLASEFGLTPQDARSRNSIIVGHVFLFSGLAMIQWFVTIFSLTKRDILPILVKTETGFIFATYNKFRWLHETFHFTLAEVLASGSYTSIFATGSLEYAQWFARTFELTAEDVRRNNCEILRDAAANGNSATVRWLIEEFDLTADDIKQEDNEVFTEACFTNDLELAHWLAERYHLAAGDARSRDNLALRSACASNNLPMVQWLVVRFDLTAEDMHGGDYGDMLQDMCSESQATTSQWMIDRFGAEAMPSWVLDHAARASLSGDE